VLLPRPGLILNSAALDALLAFAEPESALTSLEVVEKNLNILDAALLLRPSRQEYSRLTTTLLGANATTPESDLLRSVVSDIPALLSLSPTGEDNSGGLLSTTTHALTLWPPEQAPNKPDAPFKLAFNATAFMRETSFIRIHDESLPGPEYDVPYAVRAAARPKNEGARKVWERVYESFRARRQDTCGLDLDVWRDRQELR
jgi:hypothetical protein